MKTQRHITCVKSFGRRRRTKVPAEAAREVQIAVYGDIDLRPMSVIARLLLGSFKMDAERRRRYASLRSRWPGRLLIVKVSVAAVNIGTRGSVAGG